ncbi:MAG: hypothetical protein GWO02_08680 [Gammaproteobacteria bacterium]|nr:hypothetical protein [Gammaproteobacteria bacterium]
MAISADPYRAPDPSSEGIRADPGSAGVFSSLVAVENLGERRLLLRRPEITLAFPDGTTIEPVSGSYLAAALATKRSRLSAIGNLPGAAGAVANIVNLVIALRNYAAFESETAEATVYRLLYERDELGDASLEPRQRVEGYVHFHVPPNLRDAGAMTLIIPVVEPDTATRYIVSLPLDTRDGGAD